MRHQDHESQPLPPDPAERNLITRIYISRRGPSSTSASTISAITGKKRGRLWNAPKPFEVHFCSALLRKRYMPNKMQSTLLGILRDLDPNKSLS